MKHRTLILTIVLTSVFSLYCHADSEVLWTGGSFCPGSWTVDPSDPTNVTFSGPTETITNSGCAIVYYGGVPTIDINYANKTVMLWFMGPVGDMCLQYWAPVCGLEGWFGPLDAGNWMFSSPFANIQFQVGQVDALTLLSPNGGDYFLKTSTRKITWQDTRNAVCGGNYLLDYSIDNGTNWLAIDPNPVTGCSYDWQVPIADSDQCLIRITDQSDASFTDQSDMTFYIYQCQGPVTGDNNGDCYVNNGEFGAINLGWLTTTDMLDILDLAGLWLNCGNPYDPTCP